MTIPRDCMKCEAYQNNKIAETCPEHSAEMLSIDADVEGYYVRDQIELEISLESHNQSFRDEVSLSNF